MHVRSDPQRWVLLVTEGITVAYPPEVYRDRAVAEREGERWAWLVSTESRTPIERPFGGRWQVGERWVRLVDAHVLEETSDEIWVGTYWTRDGVPEPEAELFGGRDQAREWVVTPGPGRVLYAFHEWPWLVAATFKFRGDEEEATAYLAKVMV